jgi:hypothetical protein
MQGRRGRRASPQQQQLLKEEEEGRLCRSTPTMPAKNASVRGQVSDEEAWLWH